MVIVKTFDKRKQVASPFVFEVDEQRMDEIFKMKAVSIKNMASTLLSENWDEKIFKLSELPIEK